MPRPTRRHGLEPRLPRGPQPESLALGGSEGAEQTALFCWAALPTSQAQYPELKWMFHIPNGGTRDKREAGQLKAQGVKPGVPDVFLPVKRGGYAGFWIEMKAGRNTTSEFQDSYLAYLTAAGYACSVCYSWTEARSHIERYLAL